MFIVWISVPDSIPVGAKYQSVPLLQVGISENGWFYNITSLRDANSICAKPLRVDKEILTLLHWSALVS